MATTRGIVGEKLGMTQVFVETRAVPVTVIKAGPCVVTQIRTPEADGYGAGAARVRAGRAPRHVNKPEQGHFDEGGRRGRAPPRRAPHRRRGRLRTGPGGDADIFTPGERVDVVGVSKGKGFTGVMRRHGFAGLRGSHGVHKKHRAPGAIGACATPSRVFKGMRMAGQHGNTRVTVLNLEVVQADAERGLLLVKGAVPGPDGGLVMVRSAVKAPAEKGACAMTTVDVFDAKGMKAAKREPRRRVFEAPVNVPLMHQVVVAGMAGIRAGTHKVKTRGEVRGGGRKPWRQKGTGRARQGSIRSPQWAGGGVAHGPVPRDHVAAREQEDEARARSARRSPTPSQSGKLAVVTELAFDAPKTKDAVGLLEALELDGRVLVVLPEPTATGRRRALVPQPAAGEGGLRGRARRLRPAAGRPRAGHHGRARRPRGQGGERRMKSPRDVIIRPVVSEKSYAGIERNAYTFLVDPRANKTEIKEAVQAIWGVRVTSVNTLHRQGKMKRRGYTKGKRADQKRAIVTLAEGDAIEIFESGK